MKHVQIDRQATVQADRITLRPLAHSDVDSLTIFVQDVRLANETRSVPHPLPAGWMSDFITATLDEPHTREVWVIQERQGVSDQFKKCAENQAEILGVIYLRHLDRGQSQLGCWITPEHWKSGVAFDAIEALIEANPFGNSIVFAEMFQDNPTSARVMSRCGFDYIGDAECNSESRSGCFATWTYMKKI